MAANKSPGVSPADVHSASSSARENVLEHLFKGELLRCLWVRGFHDVEVLRAEVDNAGYDLVVEANATTRHVQLKSSHRNSKTAQVGINTRLAGKPSGCVLWIRFDPATLELGPFLWFGGAPGQKLPPLGTHVGKHTKANKQGVKAERPSIRVLKRSEFTVLETVDDVADALFGRLTCKDDFASDKDIAGEIGADPRLRQEDATAP